MKAADLARVVFEHVLALVERRLREEFSTVVKSPSEALDALVERGITRLREDFKQAVIELRFDAMDVQLALIDLQALQGKLEAAKAYERGRAIGEGMDITVEPLCARCGHGKMDHVANDGGCIHCGCVSFVERE